ncbi:AraC family transcriptional regulator [Streptomyces chartreusis]|uniref:AraC family transcriptional regulator n=1 Tax=Streptomyces chartreusis TaxID=1969 RepID=UPI0036278A65
MIHTQDPGEAKTRTQQLLGNVHQMKVSRGERAFLAHVEHRAVNGLGLMSSEYGTAVQISCSPPVSIVTVNLVFGGRMLIDSHTAPAQSVVADDEHAGVFSFADDVTMQWTPGLRQLMLTIDRTLLERHLRNLLNEPVRAPLLFAPLVELRDGGGQGMVAAVRTLRQTLRQCGKAGPPPVLAKEVEHVVLTSLLLGQRHNYTERIFSAQPLPPPRLVRRVVDLIHSAPETAFTVADLAEFAGVSERGLHAAFRRQLGTTPMSYLRRHRLERAHDELLRLDPATGVKVTDVAVRYGFTHMGRFAAAYRERFGEPPSVTIRR